MKTNILFVNALIATLFVVLPLSSQATCSTHKSEQAGNETSVGGNKYAGDEGTGVEDKKLAGGEGTGAEGQMLVGGEGTGAEDKKIAGGEGTGAEGQMLVGNKVSIVPASQ